MRIAAAAYAVALAFAFGLLLGGETARRHPTFEDRFGTWVESEFWRKRDQEIFQFDRWRHYSPHLSSRFA